MHTGQDDEENGRRNAEEDLMTVPFLHCFHSFCQPTHNKAKETRIIIIAEDAMIIMMMEINSIIPLIIWGI